MAWRWRCIRARRAGEAILGGPHCRPLPPRVGRNVPRTGPLGRDRGCRGGSSNCQMVAGRRLSCNALARRAHRHRHAHRPERRNLMDLSRRSSLPELMDDPALAPADYARCLRDLTAVNRVTFTHRPTLRWSTGYTRLGGRYSSQDPRCRLRGGRPAPRYSWVEQAAWVARGARGRRPQSAQRH